MIPRLVSGVPQLVTFAVDGLIEIHHEVPHPVSHASLPSTWRVDGDSLIETAKWERLHHYRVQNEGEKSAVLFIEHSVADKDWLPIRNDALVETQDPDAFRYRIRVATGHIEDFEVAEQMSKQVEWSSRSNLADLQHKLKETTLEPMARKLLQQWAAAIEQERVYVIRRERINRELHQANQEQNRIKELLSALTREDELHQRYLTKLSNLENEIDSLREALKELQSQYEAVQDAANKVSALPSDGR
jgi:DNA repair exonuclease SbcCD ATPase subunit